MISKELITDLVLQELDVQHECLVSVKVSTDNIIGVLIDGDTPVSVKRCIELTRHINGSLDRDVEDYSLEVSSASLSEPFTLPLQFQKHLTHPVTVVGFDGLRVDGTLERYESDDSAVSSFVVIESHMVKQSGSKKKVLEAREIEYKMSEVKKIVYSFG